MITLTSDIGDSYAAQIKGKILSMNPDAKIVDIIHDIPPQDVRAGAFVLMTTLPHFPEGVHVCVVDPGVGSERRGLVVQCQGHVLVGPDNGVLIPAARALGLKEVYAIGQSYFENASPTFHGRDVFAPIAARIDAQERASKFGQLVDSYVDLDFGLPSTSKDRIECEVIYADRFGNAITNVPAELFFKTFGIGDAVVIAYGRSKTMASVVRTYSDGKGFIVLASSSGFVEIAEGMGSATKALRLQAGSKVAISRT